MVGHPAVIDEDDLVHQLLAQKMGRKVERLSARGGRRLRVPEDIGSRSRSSASTFSAIDETRAVEGDQYEFMTDWLPSICRTMAWAW
jgi:hypothetical protein